jgi:pimeloyl-ACP methyl ester carboxylesterase
MTPPLNNLEGDYVLVHGFRTSQLYNTKTKEGVWMCNSTLQDLTRTIALDLPLYIQNNEPDQIVPYGLLKIVPSLRMQFYESFCSRMHDLATDSNGKMRFHEFSYDWRRHNEVSAAELMNFLRDIYDKHGKPINVLAHSNGGVITLLALHSKPYLFAGVVFVGTPFRGLAGSYYNLKVGFKLPNLPVLLDAASCFALRPTFSLLPPTSIFMDENEQPINIETLDPEIWKQSTFTDVLNEDNERNIKLGTAEQRFDYLKSVLRISRRIYASMNFRGPDFKYPPIVVLAAKSVSTVVKLPLGKNANGLWQISYDSPKLGEGDGIVPFESAKPPENIPYELLMSETHHLSMFENLNEIGDALAKLKELQARMP